MRGLWLADMYRNHGKRLFDVALSAALLVVLAPVYAAVALIVLIFLGRPVLFVQRRPGKDEKLFAIQKFRTMLPPSSPGGEPISESRRITRLGRVLRKTSLDELPQLINILKGDMSFVGPRPLLEEYLPYYTGEEKLRHSVRPGLTGWAQIEGRNLLGARQRLALDVEYARKVSFAFDLKILIRTPLVVFFQEGVQVCPAEQSASFVAERRSRAAAAQSAAEGDI
jgi:undecaprenyl phosphate N,N'-diacetylbacillosamine 1-phosphate transferase